MNCANMSLIREERKLKEEEKRKREDKTDDTVPVLGQVGINLFTLRRESLSRWGSLGLLLK